MRKILIVGASSAIAHATARLYANDGDALFLIARDKEKLAAVSDDLKTRGASRVFTRVMDALDFDRHEAIIEEAFTLLDGLDIALVAYGTLPDQGKCEISWELTRKELEINCLSTISLLTRLGIYFRRQQAGTIAVLSSVAGDRGRKSNYVYGTAKGAVSIFLQGLRNSLHGSAVNVITIKLGFVDTPMTAGFDKGILWASPEKAAGGIYRSVNAKKDLVYVPWFWRYVMTVIRLIPERIFKRLKL